MTNNKYNKSVLETLVPVNSLASGQLEDLLVRQDVEVIKAGEVLFYLGEQDNTTLYLLGGEIALDSAMGEKQTIKAGDIASWHPVAHHQPRRYTATALTDVTCIRFDSYRLDTILSWDQSVGYAVLNIGREEDSTEWISQLLRSNIFYKVPPENIMAMFKCLVEIPVRAGEQVIIQGGTADSCYFIKEGVAEVTVSSSGLGSSISLALLGAGDWFGEEALLSNSARNANVTMNSDGMLMQLNKKDFYELLVSPELQFISYAAAVDAEVKWVDVRLPSEYRRGHLFGAMNLPLNTLRIKNKLLNGKKFYVLCCSTGRRSAAAAFLLKEAGLNVAILDGGINALNEEMLVNE